MCALVTGVQTCALPICQVCAGSRQGAAASAESSRVGRAGDQSRRMPMITVHLRYEIDPDKIEEFTHYSREWIRLVGEPGGTHHGYFLPSEGDHDEAFALFTFPPMPQYAAYRVASFPLPECVALFESARASQFSRRYAARP